MKREVVVVAGCRTAQGTFGGSLRDVPAHELLRTPLLEVVRRAGIDAEMVDNVIVGQVYQTSQALNIGRYCALDAGLPFRHRNLVHLHAEFHVFPHRHVRIKRVGLKHHGHVAVGGGKRGDIGPANRNRATRD